jgi:hypothetical protein
VSTFKRACLNGASHIAGNLLAPAGCSLSFSQIDSDGVGSYNPNEILLLDEHGFVSNLLVLI